MKKRLFSALLALVMVMALLPATALTASAAGEIDFLYGPSFRQNKPESSNVYRNNNTMAVTVRDTRATLDTYDITVKGPGSVGEKQITTEDNVNYADSAGIVRVISWTYDVTQPGEYTIKVVPKGETYPDSAYPSLNNGANVVTRNQEVKLNIVKITFDPDDSYGTLQEPNTSIFAVPGDSLSQLGIPEVTPDGEYKFVGWHTDKHTGAPSANTVPQYLTQVPKAADENYNTSPYTDYAITLYAKYGATPKKLLRITDEGDTADYVKDGITLTPMEVGDTPTATKLTLKNGGNLDFSQIQVLQTPSFLKSNLTGNGAEAGADGIGFNLPANSGQSLTLTLTPNDNLSAGDYSGVVNISVDRTMYMINVKLKVSQGKVTVTLSGDITKEYGQEKTQNDILNVVEVAWTDTEKHRDQPAPEKTTLGLVFSCGGLTSAANAGEYPIGLEPNSNYEVTFVDGDHKLKVEKANVEAY